MDTEEREKLDRIEQLVEENNEIIHKLHRYEKWRRFTHIAYWVFIIALSLGAYYIFQPYLEAISGLTGSKIDFSRFIPGFGGE